MALTVYGIRNCNTVKSALRWLTDNGVDFDFHDFKSKGIDERKLKEWSAQLGWENLVNKRGTTWRRLAPEEQARITNESSALSLMRSNTSVIKRPVIESGSAVMTLGFDPVLFEKKYL